MFYIMFHISIENRCYQGCWDGMKIIDLKVSLKLKMFLLIMRALLNIVCNTSLNVLHYMTTWCASYVGIKNDVFSFYHGT